MAKPGSRTGRRAGARAARTEHTGEVMERSVPRIDNFTDAAFAFAVTLMVVGGSGIHIDGATLESAVAAIPAFAFAFAMIAMFWWAHVRWRDLRGPGGWRALMLTLLLIFTVLVFVVPLRGMAVSFTAYLAGDAIAYRGDLGQLSTVYAMGFTVMSLLTMLLFHDALRNPALAPLSRRDAMGRRWIWLIASATGVVALLASLTPPLKPIAQFAYATLPLTIGVFQWRYDWDVPAPADG